MIVSEEVNKRCLPGVRYTESHTKGRTNAPGYNTTSNHTSSSAKSNSPTTQVYPSFLSFRSSNFNPFLLFDIDRKERPSLSAFETDRRGSVVVAVFFVKVGFFGLLEFS